MTKRRYKDPDSAGSVRPAAISAHNWPRASFVLEEMARTGYALRQIFTANLATETGLSQESAATKRVFYELKTCGLIQHERKRLLNNSSIVTVRLTPGGEKICAQNGWTIAENEWVRLENKRKSRLCNLAYVGATLKLSHLFRDRQLGVSVAPDYDVPYDLVPDLSIELDKGKWLPVRLFCNTSFDTPSQSFLKRLGLFYPQGIGIIFFTTAMRQKFLGMAQKVLPSANIADLETLLTSSEERNKLWTHTWKII